MMKTPKQTHNLAFTLVETMVAVVILGMAIAAMHSTWMAILGATKSGARATAQIQRERVALSTMELALNCSIIYFNETRQNQGLTNAYSFAVEDVDGYKSVSFVARLPEDFLGSSHFPYQPIRRVTLAVEPTQGGRNDLVMRQWQLTKMERAMEEGDDGLGITLARDVDLFEVKFWSSIAEDYVDYWDEPEVLPKRIRLFLALRDEEGVIAGEEALSMREFALVSDVIDEDMISPDPPPPPSRGGSRGGGRDGGRGDIDRRLAEAVKSGRITKAQAEAIKKRMQQGGGRGQGGRGPVKAVRPTPGGSKGGGFSGTIVGPGGSGGAGKGGGKK
ncbi:MAG: type II secretion system protein [Verrucomicrobiota bacterium]|jgi:type II secretory pathway pseudopilin PulG|nr:type II secretion system protein [Verrucomicrobiota bacterium]